MSPHRMRVERALDLIPDSAELLPLRDALIGGARGDEQRAWAASEAYATVDTRLVDADALEAEIPALVEHVARRTEAVYRQIAAAVRAAQARDFAGAARALVSAGEVEEEAGRLGEAEAHYQKALAAGRKPRDRRVEGLALRRLGRVARARGDLASARRLYAEGYEVARAQRDSEGVVVACQGLGNVSGDQGRWAEAGEWYQRGLEILGSTDTSRSLWQLQSNLSVVARKAGDLSESRRWIGEATRTLGALGDETGQVYVSNAEGLLLVAEQQLGRAEAVYRSALERAIAPVARATLLANLAECLLLQGRGAESEMTARELERVAAVHRLTSFMVWAYRLLGAAARARRDREGFVFYEQALELSRAPGVSPLELAVTQREYAGYEAALGETRSAVARLRDAASIAGGLGAAAELGEVLAELRALGAELDDAQDRPTNETERGMRT